MKSILKLVHLELFKEPGMDGYQIVLLNSTIMPFLRPMSPLYNVYIGPYAESKALTITNRLKLNESLRIKNDLVIAKDTIDLAKNFAKIR